MGRRRKSKPPKKLKNENKSSGLGGSVRYALFLDVLYSLDEAEKKEFNKVLEEFKIAIVNDYLKNNINTYIVYTKNDVLRLHELALQKSLSFMNREYFKYI